MTTLSDYQLVQLARRGNSEAVAVLYRRHLPSLLAESRCYAGRDVEPFDLVQEAWLRMLGQLHRFAPRKSFSAWAITVVRNLGRDTAGSRARRRRLLAAHPLDRDGFAEEIAGGDPLRPFELGQYRHLLNEHMGGLTRRQRTALALHIGERRPSPEVGMVMGCSPLTVRTTCHFALLRLRREEQLLRRRLAM